VRKRRNRDRSQLALDLEPRDPTRFPFPAGPNMKGLIEALSDLLLEALGERTTAPDAAARQGGGHEPQDHV
jgi:hypothetical protein